MRGILELTAVLGGIGFALGLLVCNAPTIWHYLKAVIHALTA